MVNSSSWIKFSEIIRDVFRAKGSDIIIEANEGNLATNTVRRIDAMVKARGSSQPVEIKLYRQERISLSVLRDASSQASNLKIAAQHAKPLLIIGAKVEESQRTWAESEFDIEIWDSEILIQKAGPLQNPLLDFFNSFHQQRQTVSEISDSRLATADVEMTATRDLDPPARFRGDLLIRKLKGLAAGKQHAASYEIVCRDIIDYLFGEELKDPRSQKRTTDGINIYDLVYRIDAKTPFWITLSRDFRARVILFECKNYGKPIGANQIFTTERYLSTSAFRPVCFVLTRKPPHRHAVQAAFGSMRETGKLLVVLSDDDLMQMLVVKDAQLRQGGSSLSMVSNDPSEILDQRIYDFLSTMPR